jgi:hypothetical protein
MSGLVCLSVTSIGLNQAIVSCYQNNAGAFSNIFYYFNNGAFVNMVTILNWDPTWQAISARKMVAFGLDNSPDAIFLATITPNSAITPTTGQIPNNGIDVYMFNFMNSSLTNQTRITSATSNLPFQNNLNITDVAVSGDTLFLLANNYLLSYVYLPNPSIW